MLVTEQARSFFKSFISNLLPLVTTFVLTGALVLIGCDSTDATEPENEVADVAIVPGNASIAVGEDMDFSVVALNASGDIVQDADLTITWKSTDPAVFTVEDNGLATGQDPGTAACVVEASNDAAGKVARFVGRDSAFVSVF